MLTGSVNVHRHTRPEWLAKRTLERLNAGEAVWWRVNGSGHDCAQRACGLIGGTDQLWFVNKWVGRGSIALWYWSVRLGQLDSCADPPRRR